MKSYRILLCICLSAAIFHLPSSSQAVKLYPTNWWVGMKWNKLQLIVHRPGVALEKITIQPYAGVKLVKASRTIRSFPRTGNYPSYREPASMSKQG